MYQVHYLTDRGIQKYLDTLSGQLDKSTAIRKKGRTTIANQIIDVCYSYFEVPKEDRTTKCRLTNHIRAKQFACHYIKKEIPIFTLSQIGEMFNIDHSTVIHSCRKIDGLIDFDNEYTRFDSELSSRIKLLYV